MSLDMQNNLHARSDVLFGNLPTQGTLACEVWDTPEQRNQWFGLRIPLFTYQTLKRQGELEFIIHFFKSNKHINLTNWPNKPFSFFLVPWFPISGRRGPWVTCGRLDFKVGAAYLDTKKSKILIMGANYWWSIFLQISEFRFLAIFYQFGMLNSFLNIN